MDFKMTQTCHEACTCLLYILCLKKYVIFGLPNVFILNDSMPRGFLKNK